MNKGIIYLVLAAIFCFGCQSKDVENAQFRLLRKSETGLDFENTPIQNGMFNALSYAYFFNGGGVAAGDFNNDGLVDLFFTSNQSQNKLFINEGNLKFKDVTENAGLIENLGSQKWNTGASVVDINNDGMLDIYVNTVGDFKNVKDQNQLWVCQKIENGIPFFEDLAIRYNLDLQCFGTQATFFDYDLDGDLDMYQLNHSLHQNGTFGQRKSFAGKQHPLSGDKLMQNDGKGKFTEVTLEAGINSTVIGYGLGIVTGDVNLDGWPDIYIGNDFHENDYLYINQQNGTFKEVLTESMQHTSRFSMGVDCGDVNNDGWADIVSLDMKPEDPTILRSSLGEDGFSTFQFKLGYGYNVQFAQNALQMNLGLKQPSALPQSAIRNPQFAEISHFAGMFATDWSWSSLFMDFDQDGKKDLFISNGIPRRLNNIDYINFMAGDEKNQKWQFVDSLDQPDLMVVERMPKIKLPNKFFHNVTPAPSDGEWARLGVKFEDIGSQIAGSQPSYSNGSIYADLDNDGDLDVVTNNIEDEPFIYQNLTVESKLPNHNYLKINLKGSPKNLNAISARAVVFKKNEKISYENYPVRGFQSSMLGPLHLGIGDTATVDSVLLIWPDRSYQRIDGFRYNTTLEVAWKDGLPMFDYKILNGKQVSPFQFSDATAQTGLNFQHKENPFVEFNREGLIPHMVSAEGPALAVGDVNGDGLDDVFFGAAKRVRSALYLQTKQGKFELKTPAAIIADSIFEDVDAVFTDLDKDGDQDLVVAAGGNEYRGKDEAMKQRWYKNDGNGNFQRIDFQDVYMTAACVSIADFNKDGLSDVFLGARALPWNYGLTPTSVLLQNKGNGQFENVTTAIAPGLAEVGLVKNASWVDLDKNGSPDLLLAMEWGPLTVFYNDGKSLAKSAIRNPQSAIATAWWNFALPHDFDGDGDMDILAGNMGLNGRFNPTPEQPVRMYVADFDKNEQVEQLLTFWLGGKETPFATHAEFIKQLPNLKKKFLFAKDFANASAADLVGVDNLSKAMKLEANEFASMYFENLGDGKFKSHPLPDELQLSSLNAAQLADLDGDGRMEVLLGGNFFECNIEMGRYDANYGNVLSFEKVGKMQVLPLGNLKIDGEVRRIRLVVVNGKPCFVFARNNAGAVVLKPIKQGL
ncbi:MAG: VCBS repeat-containing protein [Saprospiraceae bacterium]|nr:VCBS repeat-containing protein [Saprospiraceae bacterium]